MRSQTVQVLMFALAVFLTAGTLIAQNSAADGKSLIVVLNDGHRQTFPLADVSRIDFKNGTTIVLKDGHQRSFSADEIARIEWQPSSDAKFGRNHFLGKWEVGDGAGSKFFITLESDGHAKKTIGATHGTWTVVDGEARISWEDGWHDVIRRAGSKHEKVAFAPGKNFDDNPDNITNARNTNPEPI